MSTASTKPPDVPIGDSHQLFQFLISKPGRELSGSQKIYSRTADPEWSVTIASVIMSLKPNLSHKSFAD
jgi:hypothetical protein